MDYFIRNVVEQVFMFNVIHSHEKEEWHKLMAANEFRYYNSYIIIKYIDPFMANNSMHKAYYWVIN